MDTPCLSRPDQILSTHRLCAYPTIPETSVKFEATYNAHKKNDVIKYKYIIIGQYTFYHWTIKMYTDLTFDIYNFV